MVPQDNSSIFVHMPWKSLGEKRLRDVHQRVNYLLDKLLYNEETHVQIFDLCRYCESKELMDMNVSMVEKKNIYLNCCGIDWICHARSQIRGYKPLEWNQYILMTSEEYCQVVRQAMESMEPRHALVSIDNLNRDLKRKQPHMVNAIHAVEELIFSCYVPMMLKQDTLPVPPEGKEYVEELIEPIGIDLDHVKPRFKECWMSDCNCIEKSLDPETEACTSCGNTKLKLARDALLSGDLSPEMPRWDHLMKFLDEERLMLSGGKSDPGEIQTHLNVERARALVNSTCSDLLDHLTALTGVKDACEFCKTLKRCNPDSVIDCSGLEKVCRFKYDYYQEWPAGMVRFKCYNERVLNCSTTEKYKILMNHVFSLKYIERAMKVKDIIDGDILTVNPHMAPVINQYNCILYRYYWPYVLEKETLDLTRDPLPPTDVETNRSDIFV